MAATRGEFATELLRRLGAPRTLHTRRALQAWMQAEGGFAKNNPFNTTQRMPNSTTYNWVGVQNYASYKEGVEALVKTFRYKGHGYEYIIQALRRNKSATRILDAVGQSDWGTEGGLAYEVLDDIKDGRQSLIDLEHKHVSD